MHLKNCAKAEDPADGGVSNFDVDDMEELQRPDWRRQTRCSTIPSTAASSMTAAVVHPARSSSDGVFAVGQGGRSPAKQGAHGNRPAGIRQPRLR